MELKIYSPTEDGFIKAIEWNHAEIKKEVAEKVSYYANLIYSEDQIKEAKADRTKLNKFVQALESKRKEVKKQCLAPYEDFEKKLKEIISIVNEPIKLIDEQVKSYDEKKKAEKLEQIQEYWYMVTTPEQPLTLQRVMDARWLNVSTSMKYVQESINEILAKYAEDITTLQNLPEFSFEAIEVYKETLDLGKAIQEGKRLSDIQKRKMEFEVRKQETFIEPVADNTPFKQYMNPLELQTEQTKEWISFKALLTTEDALALRDFFNSRNIEFEVI